MFIEKLIMRPCQVSGAGAQALGAVQQEVDGLVTELANVWRAPELSADDAMMRATDLRHKVAPILEAEKQWLYQLLHQRSVVHGHMYIYIYIYMYI